MAADRQEARSAATPSSDALDDLQVAFDRWRYGHGIVWSGEDRELAETITAVLGVELKWEDDDA